MSEWDIWTGGYRQGVRLARATRLGSTRRRANRTRAMKIPPGAHVETFGEAVRWGQPFLDWGRPFRWIISKINLATL